MLATREVVQTAESAFWVDRVCRKQGFGFQAWGLEVACSLGRRGCCSQGVTKKNEEDF